MKRSFIGDGILSAMSRASSACDLSVSGAGTTGIASWCSKPASSTWNDADMLKIGCPFCTATTRRVVKLLPSRMRSTW